MEKEVDFRLRMAQENGRTVAIFIKGDIYPKVGKVTRFDDEKIFLKGEEEPILRKNVKLYSFH